MIELPLLVTVFLHTLVIYVFLILAIGRFGRPVLAELSPLTYIVVALLGSAVESGLYAGSASFSAGLVSATTLLLLNRVVSEGQRRSRRLRRALVPVPIVVVRHGAPVEESLRHCGLTLDELHAALRERGFDKISDVRFALMEVNGSVGVVPYS